MAKVLRAPGTLSATSGGNSPSSSCRLSGFISSEDTRLNMNEPNPNAPMIIPLTKAFWFGKYSHPHVTGDYKHCRTAHSVSNSVKYSECPEWMHI